MNAAGAASFRKDGQCVQIQKEDNSLTEGAPSSRQRDLIMALCGHHASIYYGDGRAREVGERRGVGRGAPAARRREEVIGWRRGRGRGGKIRGTSGVRGHVGGRAVAARAASPSLPPRPAGIDRSGSERAGERDGCMIGWEGWWTTHGVSSAPPPPAPGGPTDRWRSPCRTYEDERTFVADTGAPSSSIDHPTPARRGPQS
jgi:hypothetical protein